MSSTRQVGMGLGPISFLSVLAYGRHYDLPQDEIDDLWYYIERLDAAFLKNQNKKSPKKK